MSVLGYHEFDVCPHVLGIQWRPSKITANVLHKNSLKKLWAHCIPQLILNKNTDNIEIKSALLRLTPIVLLIDISLEMHQSGDIDPHARI